MLISLSVIMFSGLLLGWVCKKLRFPSLFGMIIAGIIIGPYALNLIDASVLHVSSEIRRIALIVILLRAGLKLELSDLKKVGRPAVLMCFVPACFEILGMVILAPLRTGRRICGDRQCGIRRTSCDHPAFWGDSFSDGWCVHLYAGNEVGYSGKIVLYDRLHTKGDCAGGNRRASAGDGAFWRTDCVDSVGHCDPAYGTSWCIWDRSDLSQVFEADVMGMIYTYGSG